MRERRQLSGGISLDISLWTRAKSSQDETGVEGVHEPVAVHVGDVAIWIAGADVATKSGQDEAAVQQQYGDVVAPPVRHGQVGVQVALFQTGYGADRPSLGALGIVPNRNG